MRYFILSVALSLFFVLNNFSQNKSKTEVETRKDPKTIMDYFLILPKNATGELLNSFEKRKKSFVERDDFKPTIDLKNGYLQTKDLLEEYSFIYTCRFFEKADSAKVIAVTSFCEYGETSNGSINFYEYQNSKWREVTDKVMPKVGLEDFFKKGEKLPEQKYRKAKIYFNLPQQGTKIEGYLIIDNDYERENIVSDYREKFSEFESRTINLVWNKEKSIFEIKI